MFYFTYLYSSTCGLHWVARCFFSVGKHHLIIWSNCHFISKRIYLGFKSEVNESLLWSSMLCDLKTAGRMRFGTHMYVVRQCLQANSITSSSTSASKRGRPQDSVQTHHDVSTPKEDESLSEPSFAYTYCARVYSLLTMFWCRINRALKRCCVNTLHLFFPTNMKYCISSAHRISSMYAVSRLCSK